MTRILLASVLLLASCVATPVPHAFQAEGFSPAEVQALQQAASQWTAAGHPTIVTTERCDDCSGIKSVSRLQWCTHLAGVTNCTDAPSTSLASTQYDSGTSDTPTADADHYEISILAHRGESAEWYEHRGASDNLDYVYLLALHEIGHTWGRSHTGPGSVMSPYIHEMGRVID
jgi:hypothetical protein